MMAATADPKPSFEQFVDELVAVAQVSREEVSRDSRLVEDLGLDSLALLEVLALVDDNYGADTAIDELETRGWAGVTAGELFDQCQA
jgi:acyl carrier protein